MPFAIDMPNCPNLAVPAEVMQHIVNVESGNNPFAIGVVGARLERQPQNLDEAVATVRMLESQGYNFSIGIAQVNRYNLPKYGLETYEKAFDVCSNLIAGARILAQCYAQSGGDWGKSFSCYYSGNFTKGYEDGYVQKVYDSMNRSSSAGTARAIPIQLARQTNPTRPLTAEQALINMRSTAIDDLGAAVAKSLVPSVQPTAPAKPPMPTIVSAIPAGPTLNAMMASGGGAAPAPTPSNEVFVPQVRGPSGGMAVAAASPEANQPVRPATDQADLRVRDKDDAFVF